MPLRSHSRNIQNNRFAKLQACVHLTYTAFFSVNKYHGFLCLFVCFFCNKLITLETHPLCKFVLHLSFYICNSHLLSTILWVYSRLSCVSGINLLWFYFLAIKFPPECVHVQRTTTFCRWLPQFYHHTATYSGCCIHRLILNTTRRTFLHQFFDCFKTTGFCWCLDRSGSKLPHLLFVVLGQWGYSNL